MITNLNILIPEIFLSLSTFSILMIGVFLKKSFNIIFNLTSLIIIITIFPFIVNSFYETNNLQNIETIIQGQNLNHLFILSKKNLVLPTMFSAILLGFLTNI